VELEWGTASSARVWNRDEMREEDEGTDKKRVEGKRREAPLSS
jgi:hypothetical protein